MAQRSYEESLRLLEACHEFPCRYTFKIIGPNRPDWFTSVRQAAENVLDAAELKVAGSSSGNNYQSLSLEAHMENARQVMEVYAALKNVPEVKMLL